MNLATCTALTIFSWSLGDGATVVCTALPVSPFTLFFYCVIFFEDFASTVLRLHKLNTIEY